MEEIREYLKRHLRIEVVDSGHDVKVRLLLEGEVLDWD